MHQYKIEKRIGFDQVEIFGTIGKICQPKTWLVNICTPVYFAHPMSQQCCTRVKKKGAQIT